MDTVIWLFTLGYIFQMLGSALLLYKVTKQRAIYGISEDTQYILLLSTIARCVWIFDTRLTGLYLAYFDVTANILLGVACCYYCYSLKDDMTQTAPKYLDVKTLALVCAGLSFMFHPGSKNEYYLSVQMLVSFSIFMECAALLPQWIIMKTAKEVEVLTSHYIMILMVSRLCRLTFWVLMYWDGIAFVELMIADAIHTILLADFAYEYFKSIRSGKRMLLP